MTQRTRSRAARKKVQVEGFALDGSFNSSVRCAP
jgi:hypothetical protein